MDFSGLVATYYKMHGGAWGWCGNYIVRIAPNRIRVTGEFPEVVVSSFPGMCRWNPVTVEVSIRGWVLATSGSMCVPVTKKECLEEVRSILVKHKMFTRCRTNDYFTY